LNQEEQGRKEKYVCFKCSNESYFYVHETGSCLACYASENDLLKNNCILSVRVDYEIGRYCDIYVPWNAHHWMLVCKNGWNQIHARMTNSEWNPKGLFYGMEWSSSDVIHIRDSTITQGEAENFVNWNSDGLLRMRVNGHLEIFLCWMHSLGNNLFSLLPKDVVMLISHYISPTLLDIAKGLDKISQMAAELIIQ